MCIGVFGITAFCVKIHVGRVNMKNIAIKENHLYNKAYRKGERFVGKYVAVYVLRDYAADRLRRANPEKKTLNRLGISVSKKIGGAVERNRAKRIIRAAFGGVRDDVRTGFLIVISAREAINGRKSDDVLYELRTAMSRLGILRYASDAQNRKSTETEEKI